MLRILLLLEAEPVILLEIFEGRSHLALDFQGDLLGLGIQWRDFFRIEHFLLVFYLFPLNGLWVPIVFDKLLML